MGGSASGCCVQHSNGEYNLEMESKNFHGLRTKTNISLLVDEEEKEMCKRGHTLGTYYKNKCYHCGRDTNVFCHSCDYYEKEYEPEIYDKTRLKYSICSQCAAKYAKKVKKALHLKMEKEREIIAYYAQNPHIAVDLLCNLSTKTALDFLLKEIVVSKCEERRGFVLWSIGIDNFAAMNKALGHDEGDMKLRQIGKILKQYTQKKSKFWQDKGIVITRVFAFRSGGDQFCIVTKGQKRKIKSQKGFYDLLKKEINGIGISISVGVLVYGGALYDCTALNWLQKADKALSEAKGVKGKNSFRICDCSNKKGKIIERFEKISTDHLHRAVTFS